MRHAAIAIILALTASCGGTTAKREGESCNASSECDPGLICDLSRTPHTCVTGGTVFPDAPAIDADPTLDGELPDARSPDARPPDARPPDARPPDAMPDAAVDAAIDAPVIDAAIDAP